MTELNAYDVLVSDVVLFTRDTLPSTKPNTPVAETPVAVSTTESTEETA